MGAKRILIQLIDCALEGLGGVALHLVAPCLRLVAGDDEGAGDVAPVPGEKLEGLVDRKAGIGCHGLQRLTLWQQALAEGEGILRTSLKGAGARDDGAVLGPEVEGLLRVVTADLRPPSLNQIGNVAALQPDDKPVSSEIGRAACRE